MKNINFQEIGFQLRGAAIFSLILLSPVVLVYFSLKGSYEDSPSSQGSSPSASENSSSSETIHDKLSASYCYEIRRKSSHPDYQLCLDAASLCAAILDMPSHQYYDDCKNRGWDEVINNR